MTQHHPHTPKARQRSASKKRAREPTKERSSPSRPNHLRASHPAHLEELEAAAQADIEGDDSEVGGHPIDDEAHPGMAFSADNRLPIVDRGLSVDPEDLGRQFLRDATEQDNYESEMHFEDREERGARLGELISEATLESAGQDDVERPASSALEHEDTERGEPPSEGIDLLSNVIREGSLFDQPTERGGTRAPRIESDETEHTPQSIEDRDREAAETRDTLRRRSPRPTRKPRH